MKFPRLFRLLCKMGLHKYEDHINMGVIINSEIPVDSKEVCRWCKSVRKEVKFYIGVKEKNV